MFYDAFFSEVTEKLLRVENKVAGAKYRAILEENLFHSACDWGGCSPSNRKTTLSILPNLH